MVRNSVRARTNIRSTIAAAVFGWACANAAAHGGPREEAKAILAETGVQGGIIVHLGCGDGRLTAALRANERYTVHGLEADEESVRAARERIGRSGEYGAISVERFSGSALPYADNLVNLVVAEDRGGVSQQEILRVLAPGGVAYAKEGDSWRKTVKPRPAEIDEWTHFLHDAGNNPVAEDRVIGEPRSLRWVAPPLWLRSHETPSGIEGLVTAGGRLFYFLDEGLIGITDQRLPEQWSLVARDAFNGRLLWKRPLHEWGWPQWANDRFAGKDWTEITGGRTVVPDENQRRMVVEGDRLYATLGYDAPLSILDAATGQVLATVEETRPAREIVVADGVVVVVSREFVSGAARRRGEATAPATALLGVRGETGEVLWRRDVGQVKGLFLACNQGRVAYQDGAQLICLRQDTGELLWRVEPVEKKGKTLIAYDGVVLIRGDKTLEVREGATGELLWQKEVLAAGGGFEGQDVFVVEGVIWPGIVSVTESGEPTAKSANVLLVGYDLRTGEERKRVAVQNLRSPEHHHRCYRNKATSRYVISAMEGLEFVDLQGDGHAQHNWLRGACKLGIMPANGLLYVPTDQCFCEPGAKLLGFAALAGESLLERPVPDRQRLERGEAFGAIGRDETAPTLADWSTYRHDPARHGTTPASVPEEVSPAWRVSLGEGLTQPIAAGDRVYVASR